MKYHMTPAEFRAARESLGMRQDQLAAVLDFRRDHISRMETGAATITRTTAMAMHALGMGYMADACAAQWAPPAQRKETA